MSNLVESNQSRSGLSTRQMIAGAFFALLLITSAGALLLLKNRFQSASIEVNHLSLKALPRLGTGHQRAGSMAFDEQGSVLAVTCPRYNRLVLIGIDEGVQGDPEARIEHDLELAGRPVAIRHGFERFFILERPAGDARHLEPAFWESCDPAGNLDKTRTPIGYDPDDLVFWEDAHLAFVLLSGRAEGETNRPPPSLKVLDMRDRSRPVELFEHFFDQEKDDPRRVVLRVEPSNDERADLSVATLAVTLGGSERICWLRFDKEAGLSEARSLPFEGDGPPDAAAFTADGSLLVTDARAGGAWRFDPSGKAEPLAGWGRVGDLARTPIPGADSREDWLGARTADSGLAVLSLADGGSITGALPLRGPMAFGQVEPIGLATAANWVAVCDRSGGVHLVRVNASGSGLPATVQQTDRRKSEALPPRG